MEAESHEQNGLNNAGLQIKEDVAFARTEWRIQRVGWLVLGLLMLAAVLGFFGHGLLSSATIAGDGLRVRYERFERFQRPTKVQLRLQTKAAEGSAVLLGRAYLEAIRIEHIMPRPEKVEANARGQLYYFVAKEDPITVVFHFQLEQVGLVTGQIGLIDGPTLSFNQFVYP